MERKQIIDSNSKTTKATLKFVSSKVYRERSNRGLRICKHLLKSNFLEDWEAPNIKHQHASRWEYSPRCCISKLSWRKLTCLCICKYYLIQPEAEPVIKVQIPHKDIACPIWRI